MPRNTEDRSPGAYLRHFFKFLTTFALIIGISLFLFKFTAGA